MAESCTMPFLRLSMLSFDMALQPTQSCLGLHLNQMQANGVSHSPVPQSWGINMMIMMVQMSLRRLQPDRFESLIFSSLEKIWLFASKHSSKQFSVGRMNTPLPIPSGPTCPLLTQSGPGGTSKASKKISALTKKTRWFTVSPAQHIQMFLTGLFRLSSGLNTLSTFVTGYDWVLEGVSESKLIKLESCS